MISGLRSGEAREATSSSSEIIDGSDAPGNHGCIGGLGACAEGGSVNVIVIDERRSMEPPWAPADCADGVAAGSAAACGIALVASVVAMTQLEPRPTEYLLDALDADGLIEAVAAILCVHAGVLPPLDAQSGPNPWPSSRPRRIRHNRSGLGGQAMELAYCGASARPPG
jgi:hypothetical protein